MGASRAAWIGRCTSRPLTPVVNSGHAGGTITEHTLSALHSVPGYIAHSLLLVQPGKHTGMSELLRPQRFDRRDETLRRGYIKRALGVGPAEYLVSRRHSTLAFKVFGALGAAFLVQLALRELASATSPHALLEDSEYEITACR